MSSDLHSDLVAHARQSIPSLSNSVFDADAANKLVDKFFFEIDTDRCGKLDSDEFKRMMHLVGIQDDLLIDRYFKAWDIDGDGQIDFQEFFTGLSTVHGGEEDRLNMAFKVYDLDGNGKIDRDEMMTVLKRALKYSHPKLGPSEVSIIILDLFRVAGVDPDDELDIEQFKRGVRSKQIVADCFRPTQNLLETTQPRRKSLASNPLWYKQL
jgi:Ca2+-binding EF-hand superfamily protein